MLFLSPSVRDSIAAGRAIGVSPCGRELRAIVLSCSSSQFEPIDYELIGTAAYQKMKTSANEITGLLKAWRDGNKEALDKLMPLVYSELRGLAHRYVRREGPGQTIQTTSLVHEAYLRLVGRDEVAWQNRAHFFAVCAEVMRSLLIDRARARLAKKRGGGAHQVEFDEALSASPSRDENLLALNEALERLASVDERKSRIVEMRYFGGMSVEETALVLELSPITIKREWLKARAWLFRELANDE